MAYRPCMYASRPSDDFYTRTGSSPLAWWTLRNVPPIQVAAGYAPEKIGGTRRLGPRHPASDHAEVIFPATSATVVLLPGVIHHAPTSTNWAELHLLKVCRLTTLQVIPSGSVPQIGALPGGTSCRWIDKVHALARGALNGLVIIIGGGSCLGPALHLH